MSGTSSRSDVRGDPERAIAPDRPPVADDIPMAVPSQELSRSPGDGEMVFEPEIESLPSNRRREALRDPVPEETMRILVNPFLWGSLIVLLMGLYRIDLAARLGELTAWLEVDPDRIPSPDRIRVGLVIAAVLLVGLIGYLVQVHCLDCGATFRLGRWREHLCEPIRRRRRNGVVLRIRPPAPLIQLILWAVAVVMVLTAYVLS